MIDPIGLAINLNSTNGQLTKDRAWRDPFGFSKEVGIFGICKVEEWFCKTSMIGKFYRKTFAKQDLMELLEKLHL